MIFNKMDLYQKQTFDEWLLDDVKVELLKDLHERWENETSGNAIFISATEKQNLENLRAFILQKVKTMYTVRYPYKAAFQ